MQDRRRYGRAPFFCRLTMTPMPDGVAGEAYCVDISLGGAGVATTQRVTAGQAVMLSFHLKGPQDKPIVEQVIGDVRNIKYEEGANRLGVEFLAPLQRTRNPELVKIIERI